MSSFGKAPFAQPAFPSRSGYTDPRSFTEPPGSLRTFCKFSEIRGQFPDCSRGDNRYGTVLGGNLQRQAEAGECDWDLFVQSLGISRNKLCKLNRKKEIGGFLF